MLNIKLFLSNFFKKISVLVFDIISIPIAWYGAYWLRYNLHHFEVHYSFIALISITATQIICYHYFKVNRGLWRFSSMHDAFRIVNAIIVASILIVPIFYWTSLLNHIPRSILPLYAMLLVIFLCGARLLNRAYHESRVKKGRPTKTKRVLIIGAGRAGESLVRDLKRTNYFWPIGFLDDNPAQLGKEIHGIGVLGTIPQLSELVLSHRIDLIFISIPTAGSAQMRRIVAYCEKTKIPFRTLPGMTVLDTGKAEVTALRDVKIEDLLGRDLVRLDWDKIIQSIHGKRVLVTGGGGSIGAELCRQIMTLQPQEILIIDHSEYNLYQIEMELREKHPNIPFKIGLLSVTDYQGMDVCLTKFQPQLVFHAAAYKHVPMLEEQARIAVLNNIIGTQISAEISAKIGVEKFILISSDKAVNPTNIMGATKRVAEIFCQNLNQQVKTFPNGSIHEFTI